MDERLEVYISTLENKKGEQPLFELRKSAEERDIPIIRTATERYLKLQLLLLKPKRILEVGAAVGYSSIMMSSCLCDCHIDTIENYEPRIKEARRNITDFGFDDRITLIEGDANEVLSMFSGENREYDFIFLDAAKGQYINQLVDLKKMLVPGGMMVADNVLQDGSVIDSRFAVRRRDRTIHDRMREFLEAVFSDEELLCDLLPIGDGVAAVVKK